MKKLLFVAAFVSASFVVNAQFSIGPKVGIGLANVKNSGDNAQNDSKGNLAPTFGLDTKIQVIKYLSVQTALQLQVLGSKNDQTIGGTKYRVREYLGYLQLPIKLNVHYPISDNMSVGLGVGPYVGYYLGGGINTPDDTNDDGTKIKGKADVKPGDDLSKGYIKPLDVGLVIAPFFQVGVLQLAPTLSFGMSNTRPKYDGKASTLISRNVYYGLQVSFLFGGK